MRYSASKYFLARTSLAAAATALKPSFPGVSSWSSNTDCSTNTTDLKGAPNEEHIEVIEIDSVGDLKDACAHAAKHHDWLVCDSITEIATKLLAERKEAAPDPRQAYGAIIDEIGAVVRSMRDLPCGVLCIAHEESDIDELTKKRYVRPMMPGSKLGPSLPYVFDEVYRLFVDGDRRKVRTATDGVVTAKSRSYTLDPVMDVTEHGLAEVLERLNA